VVGSGTGGSYWLGSIKEIKLWNYSMSEAEIQVAMNVTDQPIVLSLLAYYPLNETNGNETNLVSGSTIFDYSFGHANLQYIRLPPVEKNATAFVTK
jgi:hypothetical protein